VAHAYGTFANRGVRVDSTVLLEVTGANGAVLFRWNPTPTQAFDPNVADTVNFALRKVVTDGTGQAARDLGRPAAGKTGTTNENKSAWFVGYTPDLSTAVMFVKDGADGNPVSLSGVGGLNSVTGGSFPARIWTAFMKGALEGSDVAQFVDPSSMPTVMPTVSPSPSVTSPSASPTATATTTPTAPPSATATGTPTTTAPPPATAPPTPPVTPAPSGTAAPAASP
jgi:membrane peptidoglycan carboxypeptidase